MLVSVISFLYFSNSTGVLGEFVDFDGAQRDTDAAQFLDDVSFLRHRLQTGIQLVDDRP